MTITLQQLVAGIEAKNGFALDPPQKNAIAYGNGPLLIQQALAPVKPKS